MDNELATQVVDDVQQDGQHVDDQHGGGEPFLKINDRTVYHKPEDAIRGYNEAQTRITSLSGYEKVLEKYLEKGTKPSAELLEALVTDYLARGQKLQEFEMTKSKQKPTVSDADNPEFEGMTPEQIAQHKRAQKWLKDNADKLGYVSKADVEALKKEIDAIKGGSVERDEKERTAAIQEGQSKLTGWLKEAQVELTDEERLDLEEGVAALINSKQKLMERWANGDRAAKIEVIRQAAEVMLPAIKAGASLKAKPTGAATGKTKAGLIKTTPKPTPKDGEGRGAPVNNGKKVPVSVKSNDLFKLAMDKMNQRLAEQNGGGE